MTYLKQPADRGRDAADKADLRLFGKNVDGAPYRTFSSIAEAVRAEGKTPTLAVNAGMYRSDFSPMGLYVENGRELKPANSATPRPPPVARNFRFLAILRTIISSF